MGYGSNNFQQFGQPQQGQYNVGTPGSMHGGMGGGMVPPQNQGHTPTQPQQPQQPGQGYRPHGNVNMGHHNTRNNNQGPKRGPYHPASLAQQVPSNPGSNPASAGRSRVDSGRKKHESAPRFHHDPESVYNPRHNAHNSQRRSQPPPYNQQQQHNGYNHNSAHQQHHQGPGGYQPDPNQHREPPSFHPHNSRSNQANYSNVSTPMANRGGSLPDPNAGSKAHYARNRINSNVGSMSANLSQNGGQTPNPHLYANTTHNTPHFNQQQGHPGFVSQGATPMNSSNPNYNNNGQYPDPHFNPHQQPQQQQQVQQPPQAPQQHGQQQVQGGPRFQPGRLPKNSPRTLSNPITNSMGLQGFDQASAGPPLPVASMGGMSLGNMAGGGSMGFDDPAMGGSNGMGGAQQAAASNEKKNRPQGVNLEPTRKSGGTSGNHFPLPTPVPTSADKNHALCDIDRELEAYRQIHGELPPEGKRIEGVQGQVDLNPDRALRESSHVGIPSQKDIHFPPQAQDRQVPLPRFKVEDQDSTTFPRRGMCGNLGVHPLEANPFSAVTAIRTPTLTPQFRVEGTTNRKSQLLCPAAIWGAQYQAQTWEILRLLMLNLTQQVRPSTNRNTNTVNSRVIRVIIASSRISPQRRTWTRVRLTTRIS